MFNYIADAIPDIPTLKTMRPSSNRSDTDQCFEFVEENFKECMTLHSSCFQPSSSALPKRLLHFSSDQVRLVESDTEFNSQAKPTNKYATLSHCWGKTQHIKTTRSNICNFQQNIPWDDLCATFQDALTVARRLNIDWIWIDALCIIQDDAKDWEVESAKMCAYYANAFITISAASSVDGTVHFLGPRNPAWESTTVDFLNGNGSLSKILARPICARDPYTDNEFWGPLMERAWAFQENILSRRIVHYTESDIIWECESSLKTESGVQPRNYKPKFMSAALERFGGDPYLCWYDLVQQYSSRTLTYPSDKLVAISGLALRIQQLTPSRYIAGLWEDNIALGLCWYNPSGYRTPNRPQPKATCKGDYVWLSWSWVSIDGPVEYHSDNYSPFTPEVTCIKIEATLCGLNPSLLCAEN
jgi:hypothetical protein